MAINYQDARFQRKLLELQAKKGTSAMVNTEELTAAFANQQQKVHTQFAQMGLRRELADKQLAFAREQMKFDAQLFEKRMENEKEELFYGLIGGLGTSLVAGYEGARRRREQKELADYIRSK